MAEPVCLCRPGVARFFAVVLDVSLMRPLWCCRHPICKAQPQSQSYVLFMSEHGGQHWETVGLVVSNKTMTCASFFIDVLIHLLCGLRYPNTQCAAMTQTLF